MAANVQIYIDAINAEHRPLYDRLQGLILEGFPDATVSVTYGIPTFKVGKRRVYLGAWQHGVSVYGWQDNRDGGFTERHPELLSGKATIRLRPEDAEEISDDEFRTLIAATLGE